MRAGSSSSSERASRSKAHSPVLLLSNGEEPHCTIDVPGHQQQLL